MPWRAACLPPDGVVGGNPPPGDARGERESCKGRDGHPVAGADLAYRLRSLLERCRFFLCNQAANGAIECRLGDVVVPLCFNAGRACPRKGGLGLLLMSRFMDEVHFGVENGRNECCMIKRVD